MFREHPTLPASTTNTTQPLHEAYSDACGLLLPRKHCAFSGCGWNGTDAMSCTQHINECHRPALAAGMEPYKALKPVHCKDEIVLALSIYNEGIATAIRRGAPLASYSIDRKCLLEYNKHLIDEETGASVCFTCARKFPHVHGTKNNPIQFFPLLTPSVASTLPENVKQKCGDDDHLSFLGTLNNTKTEHVFGLNTSSDKYGTMNEDIRLTPTHEEFDDWHLFVPFGSTTVKVLRCPEDIQCVRLGDVPQCHSSKICCEQCRAPICKECANCIFASKPSVPPAGLSNDMMIYYAPSILYTENVTVMEMIFASVCITSIITFTLEKQSIVAAEL